MTTVTRLLLRAQRVQLLGRHSLIEDPAAEKLLASHSSSHGAIRTPFRVLPHLPSVASSSLHFLLWQILAPFSLCFGFNLHSILYSQLSSHSHLFSLYLSHLCSYSCFNSIFDATLLYMPKYHSMLCLSLLCSVQNTQYHIACRWSAGSYL